MSHAKLFVGLEKWFMVRKSGTIGMIGALALSLTGHGHAQAPAGHGTHGPHALLATTARADEPAQTIRHEIKVQRASEAAIWAMPAVSVYDIERSIQRDLGGKPGDVVYFSKPMESRHGFLTANNVTPYVVSAQSTAAGPLVVEVPPASAKVSYFGTFVDGWQTPIADVGPPGADKGAGGKYLFLPPDYQGSVPDGYLVHRPLTYGVHFAFRPVAKNGGTAEDQSAYAQRLKVYRLSQAANPPQRPSSTPIRKPGTRFRCTT